MLLFPGKPLAQGEIPRPDTPRHLLPPTQMAQKEGTLYSDCSANPVGTEALAIGGLLKRKRKAGSLIVLSSRAVAT